MGEHRVAGVASTSPRERRSAGSPDRRALERLAARVRATDPGGGLEARAKERRLVSLRRAMLGAALFLATVPIALALWSSEAPKPASPPRPIRPPEVLEADGELPSRLVWESSSSVALVTSLPSTAPDAHPSERCLPITDIPAARCYARTARNAPSDERVLRNLIIAHRFLDDWHSTSHLAAIYWRRYPRSPFLSGIRPLVYGPDTAVRPMIPPGLTPTSWTEHLAGMAPDEIEALVERAAKAASVERGSRAKSAEWIPVIEIPYE